MSCSYKSKKKRSRDVKPIHFVRIVLGHDRKFSLPKVFVREYGNDLSNSVLLQAPTGPLWEIELKKGDDQIWFENGWNDFVHYFSLKVGSSLVFRYEGHSRFNVLFIFDPTALETKYPNNISSNGSSKEANRDVRLQIPKEEEIQSDHDSAGIMDNIPQSKKSTKKIPIPCISPYHRMRIQDTVDVQKSVKGIDGEVKFPRKYGKAGISLAEEASGGTSASWRCRSSEVPRRMRSLDTKGKARALQRDIGNFKSEYPFFEVAMQPSYIRGPDLYIPSTFRKRHFTMKTGEIILQNSDGRTWSALYKLYGRNFAFFSHGWKEFALDNNLQVGDTCRFEMQNKDLKMCFTVTISRVVEDASHLFTAGEKGYVRQNRCLRTGSQYESGYTSKYEVISSPETSKKLHVPQKKIKTEHGKVMLSDRAARLSIQRLSSEETAKAFERARQLNSNFPLFKVLITASFLQIDHGGPTIPASFCKEYLNCISQDVILLLKDRSWCVRLLKCSDRPGRLAQGWTAFALENNLKVGDVCVFEMIKATNTVVFKVSIF